MRKKRQEPINPEDADRLRGRMETCKSTIENKVAFCTRNAAENFIAANHDYHETCNELIQRLVGRMARAKKNRNLPEKQDPCIFGPNSG